MRRYRQGAAARRVDGRRGGLELVLLAGRDNDLRAALCESYFGKVDPRQLARMNLFALMSDIGWTLWGAIQAKISAVDYDFRGYYTGRWERALDVLRSERLRDWMEAAAQTSN